MGDGEKVEAELRDGKLHVAGEKYPFTKDEIRSLWLSLTGAELLKSLTIIDDKVHTHVTLRGEGTSEDKFRIAGSDRLPVKAIKTGLREAPASNPEFNWRVHIGFTAGDWELRSADEWFAEVYVPPEQFRQLLEDYQAGRAGFIQVGLHSNLWLSKLDEHVPVAHGVTWYLAPGRNGSVDLPGTAFGKLSTLTWSATKAAVVPDEDPDEPVPQKGSEIGLSSLAKPLKAIAGLLIIIAVILAFKQ